MARQRGGEDEGLRARHDEVEALRELTTELTIVGRAFRTPTVVPTAVQQQAALNARVGAAFAPGTRTPGPVGSGAQATVPGILPATRPVAPTIAAAQPVAPALAPPRLVAPPTPAGGGLVAGMAGSLGSLVSSVAIPVGIVKTAFTDAANAVGSFVQKSNPAAMERFEVILDDVTGVIGQTLLPVIEVFGEAARLVGDVLMSILPGAGEMREALAPISNFFKDLREALAPVVPIIRDSLSVGLKLLGQALRIVLVPLGELAKVIGSILGIEDAGPLKSSVGAAARNISFTNPEQFARSVNVAAFRGAAGQEPVVEIKNQTGTAVGLLKDIARDVSGIFSILPGGGGKGFGGVGGGSVSGKSGGGSFGSLLNVLIPGSGRLIDTFSPGLKPLTGGGAVPPEVRERGTTGKSGAGGFLPDWVDAIADSVRRGLAAGGNGRDPLADHLDQGKRRGMDGHPGSA